MAPYAAGDDSDDEMDESKLVDFSKLMCLLCKRQFNSKETLQKHQQLSDLHKNNLEAMRKTKANKRNATAALRAGMNMGDASSQLQYRDRAKERREKCGSTAPPPDTRGKAQYQTPTYAIIFLLFSEITHEYFMIIFVSDLSQRHLPHKSWVRTTSEIVCCRRWVGTRDRA